jgi:DNA-binding protein H-NS
MERACLKPHRPVYSAIVELHVPEATVMSVNKIELGSMSDDQLWSLHEEICEILSSRILVQKRELDKRLAALHASSETTHESKPLANGKSRRKYPKVLPQYFNPETAETWAGRGKQPRWLILAQKSGRNIEDFRIKR